MSGSCFRDRCSQLISACLPKLAARVGLAPTPCGLTNRRATLTPPGNGAAGRIPTCIVPIRSRMPMCSTTAALQNWSAWQELHLRSPGPKPGALATTLHADRNWRIRRDLHPQPSRRQRVAPLIELRIQNGGKCWYRASRRFRPCLMTPDLQSGGRITSLNW